MIQESHIQAIEQSDAEFLYEIQAGSRVAFSHLYRLYSKVLYRYGYHMTNDKAVVEDVIHDVFVNLWTQRERLTRIQSVKAYLMTCVRNGILKKLTAEKKIFINDSEWTRETIQGQDDESYEQEKTIVKQVRQVINLLTDRQREIIYLRFYQNLTYNEISTLLNIDPRNAYNLASKAYAFIKDHLKKQ